MSQQAINAPAFPCPFPIFCEFLEWPFFFLHLILSFLINFRICNRTPLFCSPVVLSPPQRPSPSMTTCHAASPSLNLTPFFFPPDLLTRPRISLNFSTHAIPPLHKPLATWMSSPLKVFILGPLFPFGIENFFLLRLACGSLGNLNELNASLMSFTRFCLARRDGCRE